MTSNTKSRQRTTTTSRSEFACSYCGGEIVGKRSDAIYCSHTCRASVEKANHRKRKGTATGTPRGPYNVERKDYHTKLEAQRIVSKKRYSIATYGQELTDPMEYVKDPYRRARQLGYRSGLEVSVAKQLERDGIPFLYEQKVISYVKPSKTCKYSPDFVLPNGIIVETKGRFLTADRQKHILVKQQHPDLDIRFVFQNSNAKILKGSKTTYADWCNKNGFIYADKHIPKEWYDE